MQRPFNGGCNGGGMLRTVQRVIRAGAGGASTAEPISAAASSSSTDSRKSHSSLVNTPLTLSSSSANNVRERFPSVVINDVRPNVSGDGSSNSIGNDWECIEGTSFHGNSDDDEFVCEDYSRLFGTVPSRDEVVSAVSALQQFVDASSSSSSSSPKRASGEYTDAVQDWIEPSLNLCVSNTIQTRGSTERVYDAFHLLQKDPSVQRMVVSLSSDKAVWAAVMENEVVKELTSSISQDTMALEEDGSQNGSIDDDDDEEGPMKNIFVSIIAKAKETVMILIDKITKVVNEIILQSPNGEEKSQDNDAHQPFEDKLKASLMLSIVVLLVVIVARARIIIR